MTDAATGSYAFRHALLQEAVYGDLLPGTTYGMFGAACHYKDGTYVFARVQELCARHSPQTGAPFNFWHPDLVTLHLWLWYPNPAGLYNGINPYARPFSRSKTTQRPPAASAFVVDEDGTT